jgi:hypothetical protein
MTYGLAKVGQLLDLVNVEFTPIRPTLLTARTISKHVIRVRRHLTTYQAPMALPSTILQRLNSSSYSAASRLRETKSVNKWKWTLEEFMKRTTDLSMSMAPLEAAAEAASIPATKTNEANLTMIGD